MFEAVPSHGNSKELPRYPAVPETDAHAMRQVREARRHDRWLKAKKVAARIGGAAFIGTAATTSNTFAYLQQDINAGKIEVADSHPAIHEIYKNTDPDMRQVATYVATGMGTRDSTETAKKLTAHQETGSIYAIEYSNEEIDIYELTDVIVEHARASGVRYLLFDGYSAGGPIELAIAAEIHERFDDLHVKSITLNSSPIGEGSLTAQSDEGGRILSTVLHYWPGLAYSKKAHLAAEVIARVDRYYDSESKHLDIDLLKQEIEIVKREKIDNEDAVRSSLIVSQINLIYRFLAEKDIARLSKDIEGKQRPLLFATYGSDPLADRVVNSTVGAANVQRIIAEHFLPLSIIYIDGIGHANPGERPTEYNQAITDHVNPHILSVLRIDHTVGGLPEYGSKMYELPPNKQVPRLGTSAPATLQGPLR